MPRDYLTALSSSPSYVTEFRQLCSILQACEPECVSLETLDAARHAVAARRDRLVGRQRGRYVPSRNDEADRLGVVYRDLMSRMLARGWV